MNGTGGSRERRDARGLPLYVSLPSPPTTTADRTLLEGYGLSLAVRRLVAPLFPFPFPMQGWLLTDADTGDATLQRSRNLPYLVWIGSLPAHLQARPQVVTSSLHPPPFQMRSRRRS